MTPIYLDYNATTPIDREVADAMAPYLYEHFGNPSSNHVFGRKTREAVDLAREQVAGLINCDPSEITFTSGGTESNNTAIKGAAFANRDKGTHIITSAIEHPAVTEVCGYLKQNGFKLTILPVDTQGVISLESLEAAINPETTLISIMHANNETGVIQPVREIAALARERGILFHTDAAQSIGKIDVDVKMLGVDLLSAAGHKLYAPKGIGALFVKQGTELEKFIHGANHERNMRAGTENVLEIVGLGKACEIAGKQLSKNSAHMKAMRDLLFEKLQAAVPHLKLNGHPVLRLPNTLSVGFPGIKADMLLCSLENVAASAGAACHIYGAEVSEVLKAMNVPMEYAIGTVRFSVGKHTTAEEIERAADEIIRAASNLG